MFSHILLQLFFSLETFSVPCFYTITWYDIVVTWYCVPSVMLNLIKRLRNQNLSFTFLKAVIDLIYAVIVLMFHASFALGTLWCIIYHYYLLTACQARDYLPPISFLILVVAFSFAAHNFNVLFIVYTYLAFFSNDELFYSEDYLSSFDILI